MTPQGHGPSAAPGSGSQPALCALSAAQASGISALGLAAAPLLCTEDNLGKPCSEHGHTGVCCQERAAWPYLGTEVTCNLIEAGSLVRDLPGRQGVAATCCLLLGLGVLGSSGPGCAFSPDRRGKWQHSCREGRTGQPGREQNMLQPQQGHLTTESCWARPIPSPGREILPRI